jgi:tRNA1(Val) A37 N6-methylase TrmN6
MKTERKALLGQFLTPASTARFMARMFAPTAGRFCRLLDPGAGIGSLSGAFLERCVTGDLDFDKIDVTAYEVDELLHRELDKTLASYSERIALTYQVVGRDFVEEAVSRLEWSQSLWGADPGFTHAILNPPYKKIRSDSHHRRLLRRAGIETVNLYSAFLALTLELMAPGGQVVAIVPRSFCNGPYYRPFRELLLRKASIRQVHLFASRDKAFKDDGVLQENVIVLLERDGAQGEVLITTSNDDTFHDLASHSYPFERIVSPSDIQRFIHVPTAPNAREGSVSFRFSLEEIGISVSTGPVVDFRLKQHLRDVPDSDTVPLLYPAHFKGGRLEWPKEGISKPNAIVRNEETERWLYPNGFYCVVRRFSSKEERRRIVPNVIEPASFSGAEVLGLENHLNVLHESRHGLPKPLAYGLAVYLQSSQVDEDFRSFSGHTQVNATDLRLMKYPSREVLVALGEWRLSEDEPSQGMIDEALNRITA